MMVCSLPMKNIKRLTSDVLDTFAKYSCRVHDLTDADCWAQNGSTRSSVFATSKHQVSNKQDQVSSEKTAVHKIAPKKCFCNFETSICFNKQDQIPSEKLLCVNLSFYSYQYSL